MKQQDSNKFLFAALVFLSLLAPHSAFGSAVVEIAEGQSCLDSGCHSDKVTERIIHKPAAKATTCRMCHKAVTAGVHEFELSAKKNQLCTRCHKMVSDQKYQHVPAKRGMCLSCHDPHQSANKNLLKKKPAGKLCVGCHKKIGQEGSNGHKPVIDENCTACHDPHASNNKSLVKLAMPELCLSCHNRPYSDENGMIPATSNDFNQDDMTKHVPFKTGRCSMCHVPHSSDNYRLLKKAYPETFYTSFEKDKYFCFSCHSVKAFEEPRTTTATDFRNGNLNLHYRHVNREKGRTCRACHEHHAAKQPKLIRNSTPFGERFIEIRGFTLTETGGTCASDCHLEVSYDRLNPVFVGMKMSPREGEDATPEELREAEQQ